MEFVELGDLDEKFWERFAADLSNMHKADTESYIPKNDFQNGKKFGFLQDNYIGKTKQINTPKETWLDFFRENRLEYQFKLAEKYFSSDDFKKINKLLDNLSSFLIEPEKPALLHGDLWGGNVMCNKKSQAMLIDPACYVGHPEADIAMTELFGGFSGKFYDAYKQTGLIQPEYSERRDLYNLYHLLNHLNMFGTTYLSAVQTVIDKYVGK
jgi:fructosamine-3-kinase